MKNISVIRLLCGAVAGFTISFGIAAVVIIHGMNSTSARAKELPVVASAAENIRVPDGRPALSQSSIDIAMDVYGIRKYGNIKGPFLDKDMEDRGLTIRRGIGSDPIVYVGPEAFSSWPLLGSTLAHEIEVHCRQNFVAIHFQNLSGFDGTGAAEREAYRYELANANRFGLEQYDQDLIRSTMSYFYPEQENRLAKRFTPVRAWLDRLSANGFGIRPF